MCYALLGHDGTSTRRRAARPAAASKTAKEVRWGDKVEHRLRQGMLAYGGCKPVVEPPHEPAGSLVLNGLYGSYDFYDDVSGAPLDHKLASAARKTEIEFFNSGACARR